MGAKALDEFTALDRRIDAQTDAHQLNQTFIQRLVEEKEELSITIILDKARRWNVLVCLATLRIIISESHLDSHNDRQSEQEN